MGSSQIIRVTAPDGSYLDYTWSNARRFTTVANNTGETIEDCGDSAFNYSSAYG